MSTVMFIPKVCRVGWQERDDTYSKKLSYIIYYDEKGKLRKETSFEGWRDEKIEPMDFDNVPTSGIVLNKGIKRGGWDHFSQVVQKVRVYDPRCGGMEFEITINNLIYILMHDDCTKRELMGQYVYAWAGKELTLLPVSSEDYVESARVTNLKDTKVSAKDVVPGKSYLTKDGANLLYVGRFEVKHYKQESEKIEGSQREVRHSYGYGTVLQWDWKYRSWIESKKRHVFKLLSGNCSGDSIEIGEETFMTLDGFQKLSRESADFNQEAFNQASSTYLQSCFSSRNIVEVIEDKTLLEEWMKSTFDGDNYQTVAFTKDEKGYTAIFPQSRSVYNHTTQTYIRDGFTKGYYDSTQRFQFDTIPIASEPKRNEGKNVPYSGTLWELTDEQFGIKLKLENGSIVTFSNYIKNKG